VLSSWYLLGRLGAFNSTNLQAGPAACTAAQPPLPLHTLCLLVPSSVPWLTGRLPLRTELSIAAAAAAGCRGSDALAVGWAVPPAVLMYGAVLQVLYNQDGELEELEYDAEEGAAVPATFHEMQPLEARGAWARFWCASA
jgi:hypothetical protein